MRFNILLNSAIAGLLMVLFTGTVVAVDIKDVYAQYSNTSFDLNRTIAVLDTLNLETAPEVREMDALKMELDYLKSNLRSLEPWYAADKTNMELQDKLQNVYLDAMGIELRSKLIRAKLIQQDMQSTISSAQSKVDASKKLTSASDPIIQGAETSLTEANRRLIQAENITVSVPTYPNTVELKKRIKIVDEKNYLLEKGQHEAKNSVMQADKILNKIQEQMILASKGMQEFDEKMAEVNASVNAQKSMGINVALSESSLRQAQQLKSEAERLISVERYEEALGKIPVGVNLLQQSNNQLQEANKEHREEKNKQTLGMGMVVIAVVAVAIVWLRRPPDL